MRFNPTVAILATSSLAAPSITITRYDNPALNLVGNIFPNISGRTYEPLTSPDTPDASSLASEIVERAAAHRRALDTSSVQNLTAAAGITLPQDVLDKANSISSQIPDIGSIIVGLIMTIRDKAPLLKNTPLNGVVNLVLPIIEGLLNALDPKQLTNGGLKNCQLDVFGDVTGLVGGLLQALLGSVPSVSDLTGGPGGGSGGASGLLSSVTDGIAGGILKGSSSPLPVNLNAQVSNAVTNIMGSSAANILSGLPGICSLNNLTDVGSITDTLGGLGIGNVPGNSTNPIDILTLSKLADVLDFDITGLEIIVMLPVSMLPNPLDAPFKALAGELEELKNAVGVLHEILAGATDVLTSSDLTKLYKSLDNVYISLQKLRKLIIPQLQKPLTNYDLAGLLSVIKTVLTVVSGYLAIITQAAKNAGDVPDGLTNSPSLINGS